MPAVLNAANEVAVSAFLARKISFTDIPTITEKTMDSFPPQGINCLDDVLSADSWARNKAHNLTKQIN
jgi:1-deoxy-D-xylulose-5-phosphate reductoisomerase